MAVDLNEQLSGNLATIAQQGVMNSQTFLHLTNHAFQKSHHEVDMAENPAFFAALSSGDRTPVVKSGGTG